MSGGQYKVLVVDDVEKNLQLIGNLLADKGISILLASNGKQAITATQKANPDLILLDISMPEMNGYDVCEILKKDKETKEIPIIFLTAKNESDDIIKGFAYGAVDYITKPFNKDELISRVLTHLELKKSKDIIHQQNQQLEVQNLKILDHAKKVEILNTSLKEKNKELEELNATKDKFFSIISHDLKNPLANILNLSELIFSKAEKYSTVKLKEMLAVLNQSAEKSNKLLVSLLDWAQTQSGRLSYKPVKLHLAKQIRDAINNARESADFKQISLAYNCQENTYGLADENIFNAVIRNLLSNAIKFTNPGGEINISVKLKPEENESVIEVAVHDKGIGMDASILESLFKIDSNRPLPGTNGETGTGLGLILCREYVEKNQGTITANSVPGEGSTFIFTIPVWEE